MRKLILLFTLLVGSLALGQEDVPYKVLGYYKNIDGELLKIYKDSYTVRFTRTKDVVVLAAGTISMDSGELLITRNDKDDQYKLVFYVGTTNIVIYKPRSTQAWVWYRIR